MAGLPTRVIKSVLCAKKEKAVSSKLGTLMNIFAKSLTISASLNAIKWDASSSAKALSSMKDNTNVTSSMIARKDANFAQNSVINSGQIRMSSTSVGLRTASKRAFCAKENVTLIILIQLLMILKHIYVIVLMNVATHAHLKESAKSNIRRASLFGKLRLQSLNTLAINKLLIRRSVR